MTVEIHIECTDEFTPREVKEAVADFLMDMIDYLNEEAIEFGRKKGYEQGHKDGMTEAATTITERQHEHDWEPISTEGTSLAMVKCTICGATEYRL